MSEPDPKEGKELQGTMPEIETGTEKNVVEKTTDDWDDDWHPDSSI